MEPKKSYWYGKKRPDLINTGAAKTMFTKGMSTWNKGKFTGVHKPCMCCGTDMYLHKSESERRTFCSKECRKKQTIGGDIRDKKCPDCGVFIMRKSSTCRSCHQLGEKSPQWTGGKRLCPSCNNSKDNYSKGICKKCFRGVNHFAWKGNEAGYTAKHDYIRKVFGKAKLCCLCGSKEEKRRYEWASKAGYYSKDKRDYFPLCKSCHVRYDKIRKKLNINTEFIYG